MDQAILETAELETLIADLAEQISEVQVATPTQPMAISLVCSNLLCSVLDCDDGD